MAKQEGSGFDGTWAGYFVVNIVYVFVSFIGIFTLGFLTAWAVIYRQKWITDHTLVNGKRLRFRASTFKLWIKTIVWMLLCVVTLGFYAILGFYGVAQQKFFAERTSFADTVID